MTALIMRTIISWKSLATFFKASLRSAANPNPNVKARTKDVITFISGGMATEKKGSMPCASLTSSSGLPGSIKDGNKVAPVK